MLDSVKIISQHFGAEFVADGRGGRVSFAEAWADPKLRKRRTVGKAPSPASEHWDKIQETKPVLSRLKTARHPMNIWQLCVEERLPFARAKPKKDGLFGSPICCSTY